MSTHRRAPTAKPSATLKSTRFAAALARLDGDEEIFAVAAEAAIELAPTLNQSLRDALAIGDLSRIAALAHNMRFAWWLFIDRRDDDPLEALEAALKAQERNAVAVALERLLLEKVALDDEISDAMATWQAGRQADN